jgi:DNA-binding MarR family transcriptional regulator
MLILKKATPVKKEITPESPLDFLLRPKYLKLLQMFSNNPEKEFYVNETIRETGLSPQIVCDELKVLEQKGFLISTQRANILFYRLNQENKNIADLRRMFL